MPIQDIKKAGVGINGDAQKLMRDFGLQCEGLVDLSEEANLRLCHPSSGRLPEKWSLASECSSTPQPTLGASTTCLQPRPSVFAASLCAHAILLREQHNYHPHHSTRLTLHYMYGDMAPESQ